MLDWFKQQFAQRRPVARPQREPDVEPAKPKGRAMVGKYLSLHKYLENRYATTVVLTFADIEDLLGFALPEQARLNRAWWMDAPPEAGVSNYSDSWILASRTAVPNLLARTVVFERTS
jgi:hypothetical protein